MLITAWRLVSVLKAGSSSSSLACMFVQPVCVYMVLHDENLGGCLAHMLWCDQCSLFGIDHYGENKKQKKTLYHQ
jgi:hypothetical protein